MVENLEATKQWVLVKQIVRLLNTYAPDELKSFQTSFPEYADVLDWDDITDGKHLPVTLSMDIGLVGLKTLIDLCKNKRKEVIKEIGRMGLARNKFYWIGYIGVTLSIISNIFVCVFLVYKYMLVVYVLATIALIGLLMVAIYLKYLNKDWSSIAMNLTQDFIFFNHWEVEAQSLYEKLKYNKEIQDFSSNTDLVNKSNSIVNEVRNHIRHFSYFKSK